jgi:hypothetical protein
MQQEIQKKGPKRGKFITLLQRSGLNIPQLICNHVIGKEHKIQHRVTVGTAMMLVGVAISRCGNGVTFLVLHWCIEAFGSFVHGIGVVPWIEYFSQSIEKKEITRNQLNLEPLADSKIKKDLLNLIQYKDEKTNKPLDPV